MYKKLEDLLLFCVRGENWEEVLAEVAAFYREDLDADQLRAHLITFAATYSGGASIGDVRAHLGRMSPAEALLIHQVIKVMELILVMPSTNAVSERSFSALRRLKTYLRATMKQDRLNHLLLLYVHKEHADKLSLTTVAQNFVQGNDHRLSIFGNFL